jgi:hypothetical protein
MGPIAPPRDSSPGDKGTNDPATRDQLAALNSLDVEEYTEGRGNEARSVKRIKIKLSNKRQALMDLAKIARMLPADRLEHSGSIEHHVKPEHKIDIEAMDHDELTVFFFGGRDVRFAVQYSGVIIGLFRYLVFCTHHSTHH